MAVRMMDIARELGVSVVTVSKVLRNHGDIGAATRERVLRKIKELNYQPNFAARALVTGRTYTVGLVVPDLIHPFFAEVAKGLSSGLRNRGYSLMIASSEEDGALEASEIRQLVARRSDVVVIASAQSTLDSFRLMDEQKTPYILIDRQLDGLDGHFVGCDDDAVGDMATEHLIDAGCRRIAHIRGPEISPGIGRLAGYRRALERHRLGPLPGYVSATIGGDVDSEARGRRAMRQLLDLDPPPDGVFCFNDPTAIGAMSTIREAGLRIPGDIAVIGCGNLHYDVALAVPLSSVDQHSREIGERTAKLALSLLQAKTAQRPRKVILAPEVVARASTAVSR